MNIKALVAGAACALAISSSASAAVMHVIAFGTAIGTPRDDAGVFGMDLEAGDAVTISFSYDTNLGLLSTGPTGQSIFNDGSDDDPLTPVTISVGGAQFVHDFSYGFTIVLGGDQSALQASDAISQQVRYGFGSAGTPFLLDVPYDATGYGEGGFVFGPGSASTFVAFSIERVTATAAVPEPATWALMIMGFGAAGAMLRQRRLVPN